MQRLESELGKRLSKMWKTERMCAWLMPIVATNLVVAVFKAPFTTALGIALFATSWLLVIGTVSLRMMLKNFQRDLDFSSYWLPILHYLQLPSLLLVLSSIAMTLYELAYSFPVLIASHYASIAFTTLAALEYINYYHRQLQHFDHFEDFRRLMAGHGFRKSHLARSLAAWRRSRPRAPIQ